MPLVPSGHEVKATKPHKVRHKTPAKMEENKKKVVKEVVALGLEP